MALNFRGIFTNFIENEFLPRRIDKILSLPHSAWIPKEPDVEDVTFNSNYFVNNGAVIYPKCPIILPHGAEIISVKVNGDDATSTWVLWRTAIDGTAGTNLYEANFNTADKSHHVGAPGGNVIDNLNYTYSITAALKAGKHIYGTVIHFEDFA